MHHCLVIHGQGGCKHTQCVASVGVQKQNDLSFQFGVTACLYHYLQTVNVYISPALNDSTESFTRQCWWCRPRMSVAFNHSG